MFTWNGTGDGINLSLAVIGHPRTLVVSSKKRKKLRVAFGKKTQKKTRTKDLKREYLNEEAAADDHATGERITGKGELTRHRTVIGVEVGDENVLLRDVDLSKCLQGRVLSATGLNCVVRGVDGKRYECTVRRIVRKLARDERSAVVTGDSVLFQPADGDQGVIERVNPRQGTLSRSSHGKEHVIAANVDQALIFTSAADPPLKPNLIDRFLISAEKGGVRSIICINKIDLVDPAELEPVAGRYGRLGYDVVLTSAAEGRGLRRLQALLAGHETVLCGQSGVGKSSLLNAVQPGLDLQTGEVSESSRKGTHTTRRTVLLELDGGGWVVDTPGIRQLQFWDVLPEEVEGYFIEFGPFLVDCLFPDCTHTHEDDCGVKRAVEQELIAPARYESYRKIVGGDGS